MKIDSNIKFTLIGLLISIAISFVITLFTNISFWIIFPIVIVTLYLNSLLLEYEDNLPGGFNNPKEEDIEK